MTRKLFHLEETGPTLVLVFKENNVPVDLSNFQYLYHYLVFKHEDDTIGWRVYLEPDSLYTDGTDGKLKFKVSGIFNKSGMWEIQATINHAGASETVTSSNVVQLHVSDKILNPYG